MLSDREITVWTRSRCSSLSIAPRAATRASCASSKRGRRWRRIPTGRLADLGRGVLHRRAARSGAEATARDRGQRTARSGARQVGRGAVVARALSERRGTGRQSRAPCRAPRRGLRGVPIERGVAAELGREAAEASVAAGDLAGGIERYRALLQFEPSSPELLARIDELYAEQGNPAERVALYRAALARADGHAARLDSAPHHQPHPAARPRRSTWRGGDARRARSPVARGPRRARRSRRGPRSAGRQGRARGRARTGGPLRHR